MAKNIFSALMLAVMLAPAGLDAAPAGFTEAERRAALESPDRYRIVKASLTMKEVEPAGRDLLRPEPPAPPASQVIISKIVNIAKRFWAVVEKNYPVADVTTDYASAVPEGINAWNQLDGWQKPKTYLFTYVTENPYGMKPVTLSYKLVYTYGGGCNGKGRYLTGVSIALENVDVHFGYRLKADAVVPDSTVVNIGTREDPVAALQMKVSYKISTAVNEWAGCTLFYIDGNGEVSELAGPPSDAPAMRGETPAPDFGPRPAALKDVEAGRQLLGFKGF